jgi:ribonuclease D
MKSDLKTKGRWKLAQEDFQRISKIDPSDHQKKSNDCWRINGVRDLTPKQTSVLQELCKFRDSFAKSLDRPLFKVITNNALLNIAAACPSTKNELEKVSGVSQRQVNWFGEELLQAIREGEKKDPPRLPRKPRLSDQHLARIDVLRKWRKDTARKMSVQSDVVLPKDILYVLAEKNPKTKAKFSKLMESIPWRLDQFGEEIFNLLKASN